MGWFQEEKGEAERSRLQDSLRAPKESGREICRLRLEALLQGENGQARGVVMKLHLENFRQLNRLLGYDCCQQILSQITAYLEETAGCPVQRSVGVEFLLFLRRWTIGQASRLAEEIASRFSRAWRAGGMDCLCTAGIGLCPYPGYAKSAEEMLKFLDMAAEEAAMGGANRWAVYDSAMEAEFYRRSLIAKELQSSLEQRKIEARYRPTYNIRTGTFSRAEFYMRILIPGIGPVGSEEFLPLAEESGQAGAVEYYALECVVGRIRRLLDMGKRFDSISPPVFPSLLLQEDFPEQVRGLLQRYRVPAEKLALELTGEVFASSYVSASQTLYELHSMGVELILGNFGTGISDIDSLLALPVDSLKLGRLLTGQLETNRRAETVINGLVWMGRSLGMNVIAEGIETETQLKVLTKAGCVCHQGFLYSPTLEEDALERFIGNDMNGSYSVISQEKKRAVKPAGRRRTSDWRGRFARAGI